MRILLLTTLLLFAGSASAGLYKWVDDEGNVHYTQKRPHKKQYKRIKKPAAAPENSKPLYKSTKKSLPNNVVERTAAKSDKIRAENCTKAKHHLTNFQINRRMLNEDGNVVRIDDKEREIQIAKAKKAISDFCQ